MPQVRESCIGEAGKSSSIFQDCALGIPFALVEERRALRVLPCGDRLGEVAREHGEAVLDTLFDIELFHQPK